MGIIGAAGTVAAPTNRFIGATTVPTAPTVHFFRQKKLNYQHVLPQIILWRVKYMIKYPGKLDCNIVAQTRLFSQKFLNIFYSTRITIITNRLIL